MIDPAGRPHSVALAATLVSGEGTRQRAQTQAFAPAYSSELESKDVGTVAPQAPQENVALGRGIVARQNPGAPSAGTTRTAIPAPSLSPPAGAATGSTDAESTLTFDQAYWASQPAAVQQLQNVNPADRTELATQLANEGYSIDVPIMVWGWDPATTMAARQADGYTWVPSALQQPVAAAPGLTFDGASYNPADPPPGSIQVT